MEVSSLTIDYSPVGGGKASPTRANMIECNSIRAKMGPSLSLSLSTSDTVPWFPAQRSGTCLSISAMNYSQMT